MNFKVTKYDWIEAGLLLLLALCFSLPLYLADTPPFVLVLGTVCLCALPLYYIGTCKNYSIYATNASSKFPLAMYLWSFLFKVLVLATFVLSFYEIHWVGDVASRSAIVQILFIINRLIMIPYFVVCICRKAYKEACVAFVYDLYYQFLGPALTFVMYH